MALQNKVGVPALGVAGQQVVIGQAIYSAFNPVSDGTVKAGEFAFLGSTSDDGVAVGVVSATGTGAPLGLVERVATASIANALADSTTVYPEGFAVTVAIRGQYYAIATGSVTNGQAVLVDASNGAITYGAAGAEGDTGWTVVIPNGGASAVAGDVVIYEKF